MGQPVRVRGLTEQEGQKLQHIVRRGSTSSVRFRRAMMLLASASGSTVPVIARLVQADEDTVRDLIHKFNEIGLACLDPRWAGGRPHLLDRDDEDFVVQTATTRPTVLGKPFTRWSIRSISDTGQNLRHNIDDPAAPRTTTVDGVLTNPTTPPSTAVGVTGAAYTNNDLATATATTLFDIDTTNDRVSLQSPVNAGTLAPTGGLGVNACPSAGFDIYYQASEGSNRGYAALSTSGKQRFHKVDVLTGRADLIGDFPANRQVTDLALPLNQH
ncbi:DUF4394 domain-containing protein [Streptomyces zaomyceticus]